MSFDVGQRITTPAGEAFVISYDALQAYVRTDRGSFFVEDVEAYLNVKALRDPATLEAWLDDGEEPSRPVESVTAYCSCPCGKGSGCYRVEHVDQATKEVVSRGFPHTPASGACRCWHKRCACTTEGLREEIRVAP